MLYRTRRDFIQNRFNQQVIPFFLANFVDAASYPRRIYIDLGIKDFESSMCWIMQNYPVKFDRIYGFECATDFRNVAALAPNTEKCIKGSTAESIGYQNVQEVMNSMSLYYNYIGLQDDASTSPPTKGLSQFFQEVGIREDDFVVMKMDVEGLEFDLIERMISDGSYKLVDEVRYDMYNRTFNSTTIFSFVSENRQPFLFFIQLFVEIHYTHPEMSLWGWDMFSHSLSDAQALFTKARDAGMYIHPWP